MAYLKLNPAQETALKAIAGLSEAHADRIIDILIKNEKPSIRSSRLRAMVAAEVQDDDFASAFCSLFLSLATTRRIQKLTSEEVVSGLLEGMRKSNLPDQLVSWFEGRSRSFEGLLDSESLRLPAKALHLSTDFERLFVSGNVITDLRPVFDTERGTISGAIVSHGLRLQYFCNSSPESEGQLTLALDTEDIDNLIAELKKAKRKAVTAKEQFEGKAELEVFVVGEESYGSS